MNDHQVGQLIIRFDRAGAPLSPGKDGVYSGVAARLHAPGDPLRYPQGPEYRDDKGLAELVAQLPGKPLTLLHPNGLIKNGVPAHIIGKVLTAKIDGGQAHVTFQVKSDSGRRAIEHGTRELSVGYYCSLDGNRYQRGIQVDHLAVVPVARCGAQCRIDGAHMDCGCAGTCNSCAMMQTPDSSMADTHQDQSQQGTMPDRLHVAGETVLDKDLNAKDRHALPAKHFAVPDRETLPIEDESHVRAAMARFNQTDFKSASEKRAAYHRIVARAHELGIDPAGFKKEHGDDEGIIHGGEPSMDSKHTDDAAGGGQGIAQNAHQTGIAAPDIHSRLAEALKNMQELQVKHSVLCEKYDAETKAHGITKEAQLKAEKERDEGNMKANAFEKEAKSALERADKAEKERDEYKAQLDAMKYERDAARKDAADANAHAAEALVKADKAAEKARLDADAAVQAHISARAELLTKANDLAGASDRTKLTDREIMCDVVKHLDSVEIPGTASNDYVRAYFDAIVKRHTETGSRVAAVRQAIQQNRDNAETAPLKGMDAEKALQAQMIDRAQKAWNSSKKN